MNLLDLGMTYMVEEESPPRQVPAMQECRRRRRRRSSSEIRQIHLLEFRNTSSCPRTLPVPISTGTSPHGGREGAIINIYIRE
jgi:hypothetical protein